MAVLGASEPAVEDLLTGAASRPPLTLVHPALALDAGAYRGPLDAAASGELDSFVLVVEGSVMDESLAGPGYFTRLGETDGRPVTMADWLVRLAPLAQAVVAIGSCATWGGIPAAVGNPTGSTGVAARLGAGFRSAGGLPVVNMPGCAPSGDAFMEALTAVFEHLEGRIPLELDEQDRPRWLHHPDAVPGPPSAGYDTRPAPTVPQIGCPVPRRGWMRGVGGCRQVGGACIGCTAPDFADLYLAAAHPPTG